MGAAALLGGGGPLGGGGTRGGGTLLGGDTNAGGGLRGGGARTPEGRASIVGGGPRLLFGIDCSLRLESDCAACVVTGILLEVGGELF